MVLEILAADLEICELIALVQKVRSGCPTLMCRRDSTLIQGKKQQHAPVSIVSASTPHRQLTASNFNNDRLDKLVFEHYVILT